MTVLTGWTAGGRKRLLGTLVVLAVVGGWVGRTEWAAERTLLAAEAAAAAGDLPEARRLADRFVQQRPGSGRGLFLAARAARRAGDYRAARQLLDRAAAAGWPAEPLDWERKLLAGQTGDFPAVEPELRKAVAAAPDHPDADLSREVLVPGYLARFELAPALGVVRPWAERKPADARLQRWLFEAAKNAALPDVAEAAVRTLATLRPDDPAARGLAADYLLDRKQPAEAEGHYDWLLGRDPADPAARLGKARCRRLLGDVTTAGDILGKLLFARPADPGVLAEAGQLDLQVGNPAEAAKKLKQATDLRPAEPNALFGLALALDRSDRSAEAAAVRQRLAAMEADLTELQKVTAGIAADPRNPNLRHQAGALLIRNGEVQEGVRWVQSALAEDPTHAPSRQALAELAGRTAPRN